jgi:hypothetical protein
MPRGHCRECGNYSDDLTYPSGLRCPLCLSAAEARREDERRRRDLETTRALRELADFVRRDRVMDQALRRMDHDDTLSVWDTIGIALQRGRQDIVERLLEHAARKRWDMSGWRKMIPERLNPDR